MWQWLMTWRDKVRLQMKRARSSDAKRSTKELQVQTVVDDWDNKNWPLHLPASSLSPVGDRVQGHGTGGRPDAKLYDWLKGPCPLLHGHGRGFRQTCFLCQKSFKKWSHLKIHIALHHVFFDRPYWQFQWPHGKWCPTCLWLLRSAHKEPHVYNLCHICGERALSRGRYSLARTNPKQG